jgi:protocatechuate 3,4-dioxygenase beta subunit
MAAASHDHDDLFERGLQFDMDTNFARRRALKLFGAAGAAGLLALVGCGGDDSSSTSSASSSTGGTSGSSTTAGSSGSSSATTTTAASSATTAASSALDEIPEETAGPYPGDGSNGPNVLTESGVVRSDITTSFGSSSGTADGVPLTVELTILDHANGNTPYAGAAVYLWHCSRDGKYSMYSDGVTDQNWLRGVQEADSNGKVTFTSIYPGCYSGRWPHIHFEVYPTLDKATSASNKIATSQLAFPEDVCDTVYATDGYESSVRNLSSLSLETDGIFRDGYDQQLATLTGSVDAGYEATLTVPV